MVGGGRRFESVRGLPYSACKSALCCCLRVEHTDTFRTHFRYARRAATSCVVSRHDSDKAGRRVGQKLLPLRGCFCCPGWQVLDPFPRERGSPGRYRRPTRLRFTRAAPGLHANGLAPTRSACGAAVARRTDSRNVYVVGTGMRGTSVGDAPAGGSCPPMSRRNGG